MDYEQYLGAILIASLSGDSILFVPDRVARLAAPSIVRRQLFHRTSSQDIRRSFLRGELAGGVVGRRKLSASRWKTYFLRYIESPEVSPTRSLRLDESKDRPPY